MICILYDFSLLIEIIFSSVKSESNHEESLLGLTDGNR